MFDCKYLCVQIILFFFSTSKYCCAAMLTGARSALETEPTGDSRAEAFSSSAVAEDQRPTTIITSYTFHFLKYYHSGLNALTIFYFIWNTSFQLTLHLKQKDGNRQAKTLFWESLGITGHILVDGNHRTNLRDKIPNPAALALCCRAEEGKAQGNASAEWALCVSIT